MLEARERREIVPLTRRLRRGRRRDAGELPVTSWGAGARPEHLERPGARRASPGAARRRAARLLGRRRPPDRALRELLALQSSDWAFLVTAGTAGPYPRERAEGHLAAFEAALADPSMAADVRHLAPRL